MKALLIVFAIALCCCNTQTIPGGYSKVSATDIQNNANIQSLAQYGANNIVQQALAAGKLPNSNTNFKVTKINSVYQQVVNGINYKFNVTLTNSDNGVIINAIFTVYFQASTNTRQITASSYAIPTYSLGATTAAPAPAPASTSGSSPVSTTATVTPVSAQPQPQAGGYSLVSATDVQKSAIIQDLAAFGAKNISQQAAASKKLPTSNANFAVSKINSVYQQVVNGINYKFDVTLTNSDGITINANFVIYYQASTKTRLITSSSYSIAPYNIPVAPKL